MMEPSAPAPLPIPPIPQALGSPSSACRTLDTVLQTYCDNLPEENKSCANEFASLEHRFPGLAGSQLTDLALYLYAKNENATYRLVEFTKDGKDAKIIEWTDRHCLNGRRNPKGVIRYKMLFHKGGYASFTSGAMVGMRNMDKTDPRFKVMISGGTRTVVVVVVVVVIVVVVVVVVVGGVVVG